MKRTIDVSLLLLFFALFIAGAIVVRNGGKWPVELTIVGLAFFLAYTGSCARQNFDRKRYAKLRLGSETLPPMREIGGVIVDGIALSEAKKDMLLHAMAKSKRAAATGKLLQEIPFQIRDRWDGVWNLTAYQDDEGNKGFSINRVYYSGPKAKLVAECVGIRP